MSISYIPAEWASQKAVIVGFPSHHPLWPGSLLAEAQREVAAFANLLAETQTCYVLVANSEAAAIAKRLLSGQANIILFNFGDIWFRDIAPVFRSPKEGMRFKHNGWGGKYLYPYDDCAAGRLAEFFDVDSKAYDFVLEGGALEHNGCGGILTTRQCLLNSNRNGWSQAEAEEQLAHAFDANAIYWLDDGLAYDHTDGHIDNAARFVSTELVLCQHPNGRDDPNEKLYQAYPQALNDQGLEVVTAPSPGLIKGLENEIMPASHLNFVIGNELVIFPNYLKYSGADKKCVDETKEVLSGLFTDRHILTLPSNAILTGGGSFHCISQHIPNADFA